MKQVILICFFALSLFSCEKINTGDDIQSEKNIMFNSVQKVIVTNDNGMLIAGVYDSKVTFIKTDANFNITWEKDDYEWGIYEWGTFGGGSTYVFTVINLFQDEFNNFICVGSVMQGGCVISYSIMIIVLNQDGEEIKKEEFEDHYVYNAIITPDGGFLISGGGLLKLDENINITWYKDYPFGEPWIGKIINIQDGRFALTAWNSNNGAMFIKILEAGGDESMFEEFSFSTINNEETGNDLIELDDGGFIIAGRSRTYNEPWDMDCGITRLDSSGEKIWTKTFGIGSDEWLEEFIYHHGNEIIVQGSIGYPADAVQKTILIKIDPDGRITDSLTVDRMGSLVYHPHEYFIKYQNYDDDCVHFEKIPLNDLFD